MINGHTKIYGILGRPVTHSLSPAMHNAAFEALGINAVYVPFPVTNLPQAVAGIRGLAIGGASVTIPFKEEIIPLLDELDPQAARMAAVNTVVNQDGRLIGYNTDWLGAVTALRAETGITGEHVLLLGAGGAARAIAFGILENGGKVTLTDLDAPRAETLARDMGVEAVSLQSLAQCPASILINATPVGMAPDLHGLPIDPDLLDRFTLVMDIVYRPLLTRLLREAQARGARIIDGLQMLIHQATAQFELWTGQSAPLETMARAAYTALEEEGRGGMISQIITPQDQVHATLTLPGSKSYTHRALVAAALASGESLLTNALDAEDTRLTAQALARLGAGIDWRQDGVRVQGTGGRWQPVFGPIYLGNSGTSMRFLTALAALGRGEYRLTGSPRLCERPQGELLEALAQLGVRAYAEHGDGCPPVIVEGGLQGGKARLSGSISSQYLSALLFIAPLAPGGAEIEITGDLVSKPYVDLTLEILAHFGVSYFRQGYRYFQLPGGQCYLPQDYSIEADASSASYFWAAAALTRGRVTITNLTPDSCQGDVGFLKVLERLGCRVGSGPDGVSVEGGPLQGVEVDMAAMPDLVPTLAVLAAFAQGETVITGAAHLRHKESDRLAAVAAELQKMGITARETPDGLVISGGQPRGAVIDTYQDHRIAMSFAVAGLQAPGTVINDPDCVAKSFPEFWEFFAKLRTGE